MLYQKYIIIITCKGGMVMTVTIIGKNIQLTQALKNIIYEKVKIREKNTFTVELTIVLK